MPPPKTFTETISLLSDGEFDARATKLLQELSNAVETTGGAGKMTITLSIKKNNRIVIVKPTVKVTRPEPALDDTMFFVSPDGELCRDDPRQLKLPKTGAAARVVSISKAEDKDDN
jgi:hypothetical protein